MIPADYPPVRVSLTRLRRPRLPFLNIPAHPTMPVSWGPLPKPRGGVPHGREGCSGCCPIPGNPRRGRSPRSGDIIVTCSCGRIHVGLGLGFAHPPLGRLHARRRRSSNYRRTSAIASLRTQGPRARLGFTIGVCPQLVPGRDPDPCRHPAGSSPSWLPPT